MLVFTIVNYSYTIVVILLYCVWMYDMLYLLNYSTLSPEMLTSLSNILIRNLFWSKSCQLSKWVDNFHFGGIESVCLCQGCSTFSWWGPTWKMVYRLGARVYLLKKFGQSRCTPCLHTKDFRTDSDFTHFKFIYISKINSN